MQCFSIATCFLYHLNLRNNANSVLFVVLASLFSRYQIQLAECSIGIVTPKRFCGNPFGGAENAGVENAGVEKAGVDRRDGKCRSEKCRSR